MNLEKVGIVTIARLFLYWREAAAQNTGLRVEAAQHWAGGERKDSWCMEMAWDWLDLHLGGADQEPYNIPRFQLVESFRQHAAAQGWEVGVPAPGDFCVSVDPTTDQGHHIGIVTIAQPALTTIAGNTSKDGKSSNGDRVAEHPISLSDKEFYRVPGVIA